MPASGDPPLPFAYPDLENVMFAAAAAADAEPLGLSSQTMPLVRLSHYPLGDLHEVPPFFFGNELATTKRTERDRGC